MQPKLSLSRSWPITWEEIRRIFFFFFKQNTLTRKAGLENISALLDENDHTPGALS